MIVYQKREDGEDIFPGFLVAILFFTISTVRLVSFIDTTINFGLEKALMSFAIDIPFIIILYVFCIYFIYMLFKPPKYYRVTLTDKKEENYENELITYMAFKCSNKKNEKKIPFGYMKCYTYGTNDLILKKEYKLKIKEFNIEPRYVEEIKEGEIVNYKNPKKTTDLLKPVLLVVISIFATILLLSIIGSIRYPEYNYIYMPIEFVMTGILMYTGYQYIKLYKKKRK